MNQPKSLRELVESAIRRHETSGRQLSFMAQKHGFRITTTTINHLKAGTYKSVPSVETIRAIAWLAGVSEEVAFTAAGQPVPGPPFAEELPPGVDNLPPKARKAAIDMLRVLVDMNKDDDALQQERDEIRNERNQAVHEYADAMRTHTERGKRSHPVIGQKNLEPEEEADREDQRRILTDLSNLDDLKSGERRAEDYPDNNIPLPDDYLDLAADTSQTRHVDREREWAERGEASQETE